MRRPTNSLLHVIKDQIRHVRYTIRAEADTPGAGLPKAVGAIDLGPLIAVGSVVGTPALRAVDGLLTQVETLATEVIGRKPEADARDPLAIADYFDEGFSFSDRLHEIYKRILHANNVRNVLLSDQAFDTAQEQFRARFGDAARTPDGAWATRVSAGLACVLAEARPIRKVSFGDPGAGSSQLLLAPNIYCGAVVGLMAALVAQTPALRDDPEAVHESVESVVNARLDRFKRAMSGKSPATEVAAQFEALLPFLP